MASSASGNGNSSSNANQLTVLKHQKDAYNSIIITDDVTTSSRSLKSIVEFERQLWYSLGEWRRAGAKGVWIKISQNKSEFIPSCVRCGFVFHHVEPGFVYMSAWVSPTLKNKLPPGSYHFIGVAGFILNSKNELLVIREKTGPSANIKDFWKLPGGLVDRFEDINAAVVREVKEETGIETEFVKVATIQEAHHPPSSGPAREGTTDLYCICILRILNENQKIVKCDDEIADAQWMPLDKVLNLPFYAKEDTIFHRSFRVAADVALGKLGGLSVESLNLGFRNAKSSLYTASAPSTSKSKL